MGISVRERHHGRDLVRSLADVAWLEIREQILTGQLAPGATVGLKEQADRLGISIMPIRDAVKRLQHEGLIDQVPQREAFVSALSLQSMDDIYRTRAALESLAIGLACAHFTDEHHDALSHILDQFVAAYESGDTRAGRELHRRFHLDLYALAGSPTLDRLIPPLIDATERYRVLSQALRGSARQRREEHQEMLQACLARDTANARTLLTEHLNRTVQDVRTALAAFAETSPGS
ncbi:MAG: GntR family transcriptional regulator [Thermaerobacter sp.]|nr:GntR family transcriptional regulator [Thermaerobacter sp.]